MFSGSVLRGRGVVCCGFFGYCINSNCYILPLLLSAIP